MFAVKRVENGFLVYEENSQKETYYKNEKKLIGGIRELLGMKRLGRPVEDHSNDDNVFNGLDDDFVEEELN